MELQTRKDLMMLGCIARPLCNAVQLTENPVSQERKQAARAKCLLSRTC